VPGKVIEKESDGERRKRSADVGSGIEDAGGEGTLFFRKPFSGSLNSGWKVPRLAETEDEADDSEANDRARELADIGDPGAAGQQRDVYKERRKALSQMLQRSGDGTSAWLIAAAAQTLTATA
jgi:hypothetical protein